MVQSRVRFSKELKSLKITQELITYTIQVWNEETEEYDVELRRARIPVIHNLSIKPKFLNKNG